MLVNMLFVVLAGVMGLVATAGAVAIYRRCSGGTNEFVIDFRWLVLSFAPISGTVTLVTAPIAVVLVLAGAPGVVLSVFFSAQGLWRLYLQVRLVATAMGLDPMVAVALLFGASFLAGIAIGLALGALRIGR